MKHGLFLRLVTPALLITNAAFASDKAACLDAASKGQRFRDAHKLVEAREQFRVCAAAQCPAVVQSDCANWLADVERALPTVVLAARDGTGKDLVDVAVTVDAQPLTSQLDGQAVAVNAGLHTFHFARADGTSLDQQVVLREGEKNHSIAVMLGQPVALASPPARTTTPSTVTSVGSAAASPWKTVGWVLGGAGVVGLGVATVFGVVALQDKNGAHCDASNVCDPGTTNAIKSAALASDVGWIAGGVLLAGGMGLLLFAPNSAASTQGSASARERGVKIAPTVTRSGAALVVRGTW